MTRLPFSIALLATALTACGGVERNEPGAQGAASGAGGGGAAGGAASVSSGAGASTGSGGGTESSGGGGGASSSSAGGSGGEGGCAACVCTPGEIEGCYGGPLGTEGVGACVGGSRTCAPDGLSWGACSGEVLPVDEICNNSVDDDCDADVDESLDVDGDGWSVCAGDCCELVADCPDPALVNPGAVELLATLVDEDCDPATLDNALPAPCASVPSFGPTPSDLAAALELCELASGPGEPAHWGIVNAELLHADGSVPSAAELASMSTQRAAVVTDFGTGGIVPQHGPTMVLLSTGMARDQGDPGFVGPVQGTSFGESGNAPAKFLAAHGGALPALYCGAGCPSGTGANDSIDLRLTLQTPVNAKAWSVRMMFLTAEYQNQQCSEFNDSFLAMLQASAPGLPADGNVAFDNLGQFVSVNGLFYEVCTLVPGKQCASCPQGPALLAGTGFEATGGGTHWTNIDVPNVGGETITIDFTIFDVTDNLVDSVVLLDRFRFFGSPPIQPQP